MNVDGLISSGVLTQAQGQPLIDAANASSTISPGECRRNEVQPL